MLLALLGELHFMPTGVDSWYNLPREGGIAYAAQTPWVLNRTIRENILFGQAYNEDRYNQGERLPRINSSEAKSLIEFCLVIEHCALSTDLELFEVSCFKFVRAAR